MFQIFWLPVLWLLRGAHAAVTVTSDKGNVKVDASGYITKQHDEVKEKLHALPADVHRVSAKLPTTQLKTVDGKGVEGLSNLVRSEDKQHHHLPLAGALPGSEQEQLLTKTHSNLTKPSIFGSEEEEEGHSDEGHQRRHPGGRRRSQCWHMCNTNHKAEEYNGCAWSREKREKFTVLVQSIRDSRCAGIDTVIADAEDADCSPGGGCTGKDNTIDKDIGACVPINAEDNLVCEYGYTETTTTEAPEIKNSAMVQGPLLITLLAATVAFA